MKQKKLKVIFFGTPEFSLPSLQALLESPDFEVITVVTQEDKKVGRRQELTKPPVKKLAEHNNIPVLQPHNLRRNRPFTDLMKKLATDFIVVVAYGKIIPAEILDLPKYGCINVHASLLPKYRGASPIEAALLHGDTETGISIMKMNEKLDGGDICLIQKIQITAQDNAETLGIKLSFAGGSILPHVLKDMASGEIRCISQEESKSSYCGKIKKDDGLIDVNRLNALEILNCIRAYTPWPACFLNVDGKRLKIIDARTDLQRNAPPGSIMELKNGMIGIGTKKGLLIPEKVQLEGKKVMTIQEFLRGNRALLAKLETSPR